jgi:hypothetical protein
MPEHDGTMFTLAEVAAVMRVDEDLVKSWICFEVLDAWASQDNPTAPCVRRSDLELIAAPHLGARSLAEFFGEDQGDANEVDSSLTAEFAQLDERRARRFAAEARQRPLFHYTKPDVALDHVLPEGRLRLTAPVGLNDPFESGRLETMIGNDAPPPGGRVGHVFPEASELMRNRCRLTCLTLSGSYDQGPDGFGDGFAKARMWAQYADLHKGVCIALDQERLRSSAEAAAAANGLRLYEGAIRYGVGSAIGSPGRSPLLPLVVPSSRADDLPRLFEEWFPVLAHRYYFTKAPDWSTETEYRFLMHGDVKEYEYIDVRSAVKAIFCGPQFPDPRLPDVCAQYPELAEAGRVYKIRWSNSVAIPCPVNGDGTGPPTSWEVPPPPRTDR